MRGQRNRIEENQQKTVLVCNVEFRHIDIILNFVLASWDLCRSSRSLFAMLCNNIHTCISSIALGCEKIPRKNIKNF